MLLEYISIQRVSLGVNKCNGVINHYLFYLKYFMFIFIINVNAKVKYD